MEFLFTFNRKYKPFFDVFVHRTTPYRTVLLSGGRGSGKTTALNTALILRIMKNKNEKILYTRYLSKALYHSISDIKELIVRMNLAYTLPILRNYSEYKIVYNNVEVLFAGLFNSVKNESIKSISNVSTFIIEEATACKHESDILTPHNTLRHITEQNLTVLSFNPKDKNDVVFKLFYEPAIQQGMYKVEKVIWNDVIYEIPILTLPNVLHVHTTFLDNLNNLPKDFIHEARRHQTTDSEIFKREFLGAFIEVNNKVINSIDYAPHHELNLSECGYYFGLDLGYNDFNSLQLVAKKDKTIFTKNLLYENNLNANEIVNKVTQALLPYERKIVYCDTSHKPITELLKAHGITVRYKNTKKTIREQYAFINSYHIVCLDSESYNDLKTLVWNENEATNKYGNHIADSFRYACIGIFQQQQNIIAII